jgi:hypothetical protein
MARSPEVLESQIRAAIRAAWLRPRDGGLSLAGAFAVSTPVENRPLFAG